MPRKTPRSKATNYSSAQKKTLKRSGLTDETIRYLERQRAHSRRRARNR